MLSQLTEGLGKKNGAGGVLVLDAGHCSVSEGKVTMGPLLWDPLAPAVEGNEEGEGTTWLEA